VAKVKAVLFDLHGTLVYNEKPVSEAEILEYLSSRGHEVSPQQLKASWSFVAFVDYPRYGYGSWRSFFSRVFWRLKVKVDEETLGKVVKLLDGRPYKLYSDATEAVVKAKEHGFKTAIVTTIAYFQFKEAIRPIRKYFDLIMTGYEAGCDKSNPKMYKRILEILKVKPHEAVVVGDDVQLDILLPKSLGINTIFLVREGKNRVGSVDAFVYDLNEAMETVIRKFG
jgi:putative hydrolase of the HAD superfamily